ncbi:MAG: hypothetical protein LQ344_005524 [Seirophora lacunosa]|nr:MAG: hypothetical protein LQ344_005524 [Seirophora lacunosa]
MFPRLFPSRGPPVVEKPTRRDADSTTNHTTFHDSRSSTGSSASIADVEAAFLQGESSKRKEWKKACLPSTLLAKLRRSSSNETDSPEKSKRRLSIGAFLALEIRHRVSQPKNGVELILSRWGLPSSSTQQALTTWPTDFSRDVQPIACHSHNDYWRRVPLYDALAAGCTGVEADIWTDANSPDDLFVGHTRKSLTASRTLKSLYIDPLLTILNNANAPSTFSTPSTNDTPITTTPNNQTGIFSTSPSTSLTLLIDLKTDPLTTFPLLLTALQPLLAANYLTTFTPATDTLARGPITVVATGLADFTANILSPANTTPFRFVFFDAPLPALSTLAPTRADMAYDTSNSHYASASFKQVIGNGARGWGWGGRAMSTRQAWQAGVMAQGARDRGLVARFWDVPGEGRAAWEILWGVGVRVLSVDDLVGVKAFLLGR